jgi:hypothetical protein
MSTTKKTEAKAEATYVPGAEMPYVIGFTVRGTRSLFFNRYDIEGFYEKDSAAKGSKVRRTENLEALPWRDDDGKLCLPSTEFHKALTEVGRYLPDVTHTGRRSARPEVQRALIPVEEFCPLGVSEYIRDVRAVRYNGATVPKARPILAPGWETSVHIEVVLPEFFTPSLVIELMARAGRVYGVGDATAIGYGRFVVTAVEEPKEVPFVVPEWS